MRISKLLNCSPIRERLLKIQIGLTPVPVSHARRIVHAPPLSVFLENTPPSSTRDDSQLDTSLDAVRRNRLVINLICTKREQVLVFKFGTGAGVISALGIGTDENRWKFCKLVTGTGASSSCLLYSAERSRETSRLKRKFPKNTLSPNLND